VSFSPLFFFFSFLCSPLPKLFNTFTNIPYPHRDYATKVFGFATFGRIYGSITAVSGLGQLIQPGLDALTHGPLHDNPVPVNLFFAAAGSVISGALTCFVYIKTREANGSGLSGGRRKNSSNNIRYGEDLADEERRALLHGGGRVESYGGALREEQR
jgi:hypothetical protein